MKKHSLTRHLCFCLLPFAFCLSALAQGTAFTYQGRLNDGADPATGSYDLRFTLHDAASGGAAVAGPLTHAATGVSNGLFTVTLDFGAGVFTGPDRWLEIGVRTNGAGAFSTLSPRQALTPSPYAITAARVSGTVDASQLTGLIAPANIGGGSLSGASLAPGAAAANLNASGQAGVASGGIVLSATENPALVNAGYVKLDTMQAGNFWQQRNASGGASPPAARHAHTAIWTGSELIIWGGMRGGGYLNDGVRYNPTHNLWIPISTVGAPTARGLHTAVWTGKEMLVWGGTDGGKAFQDGGRYDPGANTWRPILSEGPPAGRSQHTAVWTGKEMLVWGGHDGNGPLNDGARYNPEAASWSKLATRDAPAGRVGHTAIWTGREMIIWGGDARGVVNDGGRYDPDENRWTSVSTDQAPSARYEHTAVWTGREMIVWGGVDAIGYPSDGGRYNPALHGWQAVTGAGTLLGREGHTAIWTGREMMIWGGANNGAMGGGASYDPATGNWMAVTTVGAPTPRQEHVAVWTGKEVIITTGYDGLGAFYSDTWSWTPGKVMFLYQKP